MRFAKDTSVSVERSRAEIEATLSRYGATAFAYLCDNGRGIAVIQFQAQDRHVRFKLDLPRPEDEQVCRTAHGRKRRANLQSVLEQASRQRWRALLLSIKAKLEAVECGIELFEEAFMAHIVVPGGKTVSDLMRPQIHKAYQDGQVPPGIAGLLPYEELTTDA